MITHDSKFTFDCDNAAGDPHHGARGQLVVDAKNERTAIAKARRKGWDVLRVRAVSGVMDKVARTVRRVYCPGCAWVVGVTRR